MIRKNNYCLIRTIYIWRHNETFVLPFSSCSRSNTYEEFSDWYDNFWSNCLAYLESIDTLSLKQRPSSYSLPKYTVRSGKCLLQTRPLHTQASEPRTRCHITPSSTHLDFSPLPILLIRKFHCKHAKTMIVRQIISCWDNKRNQSQLFHSFLVGKSLS